MTITVYGSSDDLIEIEGDITEEFNPPYGSESSLLAFSDGTVLRIAYTEAGVWRITPVVTPEPGMVKIEHAPENDDDNYSDRATILRPIEWVALGDQIRTI